ncbi:MAG: efflux RND transporter periplasmic adaptor subunit [Armatimonadota bacterium]|jgi:multidrug efflux pump subunit AcrA (membrane-fusion protein)
MSNNNAANNNDRKRSFRWAWWVAGLLVIAGLIAWSQSRPPEVTVAEARRGDLDVTVTATGDVEGRVAEVSSQIQGRVAAVYRDEGDLVRRGDLLCRITGGPSMAPGSAAQTAHESVQAPFDGVVSRRYVDPGDSATPGLPLFQVADGSEIWVTALIDDIDVGKVHEGQDVQIILPAYLGQSLPGRIERIAATATPRTAAGIGGRVVRSRIDLTAGTGPLRPGMEVDVSAEATIARDVLLIPADSVIDDETGRWVLKLVGERLERQEITMGANNYVDAQVTEGLEAGDLVVVEGKDDVGPGDAVQVRMRERVE